MFCDSVSHRRIFNREVYCDLLSFEKVTSLYCIKYKKSCFRNAGKRFSNFLYVWVIAEVAKVEINEKPVFVCTVSLKYHKISEMLCNQNTYGYIPISFGML